MALINIITQCSKLSMFRQYIKNMRKPVTVDSLPVTSDQKVKDVLKHLKGNRPKSSAHEIFLRLFFMGKHGASQTPRTFSKPPQSADLTDPLPVGGTSHLSLLEKNRMQGPPRWSETWRGHRSGGPIQSYHNTLQIHTLLPPPSRPVLSHTVRDVLWVCAQPPSYPLEMNVLALSNISPHDVGGPGLGYGLFSLLYMPPCFEMTNYLDLLKPDTRWTAFSRQPQEERRHFPGHIPV